MKIKLTKRGRPTRAKKMHLVSERHHKQLKAIAQKSGLSLQDTTSRIIEKGLREVQ